MKHLPFHILPAEWAKGSRLFHAQYKNSIVSYVSGALEALRNFKKKMIKCIKKTLTSLKYYKNVSVISVIVVV